MTEVSLDQLLKKQPRMINGLTSKEYYRQYREKRYGVKEPKEKGLVKGMTQNEYQKIYNRNNKEKIALYKKERIQKLREIGEEELVKGMPRSEYMRQRRLKMLENGNPAMIAGKPEAQYKKDRRNLLSTEEKSLLGKETYQKYHFNINRTAAIKRIRSGQNVLESTWKKYNITAEDVGEIAAV